ncbi:MAG: MFS transporter [Gammaproteobacteria bacterium]
MSKLGDTARLTRRRELGAVAILSLGFGLVGIDRFLITTLYPVIARDLHLSYGDIGTITGALAIAWGISALFTGNLSDRIGRRVVLTVSLVVFSLLIGASGLAVGLISLIAVRVVMGFADGAYTPVSIAGTMAASAPQRRGLNIGIQQMMMPLFGLGLCPLFVAGALRFIEWRFIFLLFLLPGLAVAFAVWKIIPPQPPGVDSAQAGAAPRGGAQRLLDWKTVLSYSNVRVAALLMLCWLTCLITTSAFMPNYLVDYLHLGLAQMARIMSAIGLGATAGTLLLPWASDKLGRRPVMALSSIGVLVSLLMLINTRHDTSLIFASLFMVHFFNNALITLTVGPICSEAVPIGLMATASGLVIAVGELFGGGLAPVVVGHLAQRFGIEHVLWLPIVMVTVGFILCLGIQVNQPRRPS